MDRERTADGVNRRYFRQAYSTGRHGWAAEAPSPYALGFLDKLKSEAPGGRLLDAGCGQGRHAIAAAGLGFQVAAVDYEPLALERARRWAETKGISGIGFLAADVFHLPFADSHFDIVLDYGCLHHQKKSAHAFYKKSISRVLKRGGFHILSVFSPEFHLFRGRRRPWHIAGGSYRRFFTRADLLRLFEPEFKILDIREERGDGRGFLHALLRRR